MEGVCSFPEQESLPDIRFHGNMTGYIHIFCRTNYKSEKKKLYTCSNVSDKRTNSFRRLSTTLNVNRNRFFFKITSTIKYFITKENVTVVVYEE